jgi:hypothetical protein
MAQYVELRRHTDADGDVLTLEGVRAAVAIGSRLEGSYEVLVSSGVQRATQTLACFLAGLGEKVRQGVVVERGCARAPRTAGGRPTRRLGAARSRRYARPTLSSSRKTPPGSRPGCVASPAGSPKEVARSSPATARPTKPPFSVWRATWSSRSRRVAACSSSRRTEQSVSRSSVDDTTGFDRANGPNASPVSERSLRPLAAPAQG